MQFGTSVAQAVLHRQGLCAIFSKKPTLAGFTKARPICYNSETMRSSRKAKYTDIFNQLRKEILNGRFADLKRFPSEETLVRRFGVSRPTIERALRELKQTGLLESRAGSGFYLSLMARNATGAIGLIVPDYQRIDFFTALCTAISRKCRDSGYTVLLGDSSTSDPSSRGQWMVDIAREYVDRRVAGVILEPVDLVAESAKSTREALEVLKSASIPVILIDRDIEQPPQRSSYDLVGIDNVQAGHRVARHLLENGARKLRFLTEPQPASTIRQRIQGVAHAVIDAGGTWRKSYAIEIDPDDLRSLEALFRGKDRPDAVVCRNDPLAARLISVLAKLRIDIPRSVMIAGFDDAGFAKYLTPALTSIRQPVELIAATAVETLQNRIRHPNSPPKSIQLDVELVKRTSTERRLAPKDQG